MIPRNSSKSASRFCKLSLCTIASLSSLNPTLAFLPSSPSSSSFKPADITSTIVHSSTNHIYRQMTSSTATTVSTSAATKNGISPRVLETLDPCVVLMKQLMGQYSHLWQGDKGGIFSLAQGVVYWEPPSTCQEALVNEIKQPNNLLHTYGPAQGIPELMEALEKKIATENGLKNHDVMVTVGANQAYVNCVLTTLCDDSKAVVFAPYYFNHVMALQMCCGDDSVVVGPSSSEGIPDLDWLKGTLETKSIDMVTIVNPGNPTGVSLPKSFLQQVVDLCEEHSCWLVLDLTYEYFTVPSELQGQSYQPIPTFPGAPHVIHIFSMSKGYSLAGYRCGYLCLHKDAKLVDVAAAEDDNDTKTTTTSLLTNMLKVQDTLPIAPPRISQIAACGALQAGQDWVLEKYATLDTNRQLILDALKPLEQIMGGTGAMYVMGKLPLLLQEDGADTVVMDDVEVCRQLVEEYGVAIIPGTYCGFPGWIRVCYGNLELESCRKAADRLQTGIQNIVVAQAS